MYRIKLSIKINKKLNICIRLFKDLCDIPHKRNNIENI